MTPDSTSIFGLSFSTQNIVLMIVFAIGVYIVMGKAWFAYLPYHYRRHAKRILKNSLSSTPWQPLRATPVYYLTHDNAAEIIKHYDFCDGHINGDGKGVAHNYELRDYNDSKVVLDHATGLMWQQSGSQRLFNGRPLPYEWARKYIKDLNKKRFAGFNDWRLPTFDEAMSLMEREKKNANHLHIDSVFDNEQPYIWTADRLHLGAGWVIHFHDCHYVPTQLFSDVVGGVGTGKYYVRAVRRIR